jgi:hypothetical protein
MLQGLFGVLLVGVPVACALTSLDAGAVVSCAPCSALPSSLAETAASEFSAFVSCSRPGTSEACTALSRAIKDAVSCINDPKDTEVEEALEQGEVV